MFDLARAGRLCLLFDMFSSALVRVEDKQARPADDRHRDRGNSRLFPIICLKIRSRSGLNGLSFFFLLTLSDGPVLEIDKFTNGSGMRAECYATHPFILVGCW
jgi:hypothetical protein